MALRVIHSLGGCGGTLLSRCLGVLPEVALLSEVNPLSLDFFPELHPLNQDRQWLRLLSASEQKRFSEQDLHDGSNFRALMETFHERAAESGRILVVRDYNYAEFIGVPFLAHPPRRRVLCEVLSDLGPIRAIALVRHPVTQWISLRKHATVRRAALSPTEFADGYAAFTRDLGETSIFRYEDFVSAPEDQMRRVSACLDVPFDISFREKFHTFDQATGNFARKGETSIASAPQQAVAEKILKEFEAHAGMVEAAAALGYGDVRSEKSPSEPVREAAMTLEGLRSQVEELRRGAVEWIAEVRTVHAEAERRRERLEAAVAAIHEKEAELRVIYAKAERRRLEVEWGVDARGIARMAKGILRSILVSRSS